MKLLLLLTISHVVVDAFATFLLPIWPSLKTRLDVGDATIQTSIVLWSLSTSLLQFPLGMLGDRFHARWLIWGGPALGVICISAVGLVDSLTAMNLLLIVGGVGVAAYHPEAAAAAGACLPENRSRAMSIFAIGGYLGQAAGPLYSGELTSHFGLRSLATSAGWGLPAMVLVALFLWRDPSSARPLRRMAAVSIGGALRGKIPATLLLLSTGILRIMPSLGVPQALAWIMDARGDSSDQIGLAQSIMMAGIGAGGLACAAAMNRAREWRALTLWPLAAAPLVLACAFLTGPPLLLCIGTCGLALGVTMPVIISYGQQLLPGAERIANAITMGVSWGLCSVLVGVTLWACNTAERPEAALYVFTAATVLASALAWRLPRLDLPTTAASSLSEPPS